MTLIVEISFKHNKKDSTIIINILTSSKVYLQWFIYNGQEEEKIRDRLLEETKELQSIYIPAAQSN